MKPVASLSFLQDLWLSLPPLVRELLVMLGQILFLTVVVILCVAFLTYLERKVIGYMQNRIGPNRVGPGGWLQPFADVIKLLLKEVVVPSSANRFLFVVAPLLSIVPALATWAVIPLFPGFAIAEIDAGLLYVLALTSLSVYGVILAGWASNSKYALLGAMRSAAQIVAYEIAMGFALVGVLMAGGSLNLGKLVEAQSGGLFSWFWLPLFPLFIVYFVSGLAETNRAPFDVSEGESEIVAGFHVEYSGVAFALFFLAEYANMILISGLTSIMFAGGWLSPFEGIPGIEDTLLGQGSIFWFLSKTVFFMFLFLWYRATFPRYRYDQIMRLGWKVFVPITIFWVLLAAVFAVTGLVVKGS